MNKHEEYVELDLKALLFYVLRQWKPIIIFAVVFAVLLGGILSVVEYVTGLKVDEENSYWAEYLEYQDTLALYEDLIETTQTKVDNQKDYIDNSILMKADHRNVYMAKATFYVDTDYQILPENVYQTPDKTGSLAWFYENYLQDYSIYEEIGAEIGIDAKYLMELIATGISNEETIVISITHPYERTARNIMEIFQRELYEVHDHLVKTVGEHSLTKMSDTCGVYVSESIKYIQQSNLDELLVHQENLIDYKKELHALKEDGGPGELNVIFAFIKGVIIGGVVGGVLAVVYYAAMSILKNQVHAPEQLVSGYGIPVMGELIYKNTKPNKIMKLLNKLEGRIPENTEANMHFLAENLRNHCGDAGNILICSDGNVEQSAELAESLKQYFANVEFVPAGNLLKDAFAVQMLSKCDAVLRLVGRDHSANKAIRKELVMIDECNKKLIGFVFAD